MKIGEFARRVGVPIDTVRYYERNGLLPPPPRRASGYRDFDDSDVTRLRFVLRAKSLGFSLAEVRELAVLADAHGGDIQHIRSIAVERLTHIEQRIAELVRVRDALRDVVAQCPGDGPIDACPIRAAVLGEVHA